MVTVCCKGDNIKNNKQASSKKDMSMKTQSFLTSHPQVCYYSGPCTLTEEVFKISGSIVCSIILSKLDYCCLP